MFSWANKRKKAVVVQVPDTKSPNPFIIAPRATAVRVMIIKISSWRTDSAIFLQEIRLRDVKTAKTVVYARIGGMLVFAQPKQEPTYEFERSLGAGKNKRGYEQKLRTF